MADYVIDINLNSTSKTSEASGSSARSNGTEKDKDHKTQALIRGMKKLNILHAGEITSVADTANAYGSKDAAEQAKLRAIGKASIAAYGTSKIVGIGWNAVKTFTLSNIGEKYGDQARQNQVNNVLSSISVGGNVLSGTVSGAAAGALAGPIGAVVGAAVGLVTSTTSQIVGMVEADAKWQRQEMENMYNEIRASNRLGVDISKRNRTR
jgi:hypothetical protein